jgi:hypothetical protein
MTKLAFGKKQKSNLSNLKMEHNITDEIKENNSSQETNREKDLSPIIKQKQSNSACSGTFGGNQNGIYSLISYEEVPQ